MLRRYFGGGVCESQASMQGKTVLITGGNSGLGKESALDIAKRGARVIIACRNVELADQVATEIGEVTGNKDVVVMKLDLASLASVREFARKFIETERRLDVLLNNAGMYACPPDIKTSEGYEMQFGVNHLGHFLLTNLLLDLIKSSAPSRIVVVSSLMYWFGRINFDDLMSEKNNSETKTYAQSKLANIYFTTELAKRLDGTGVTVNCLHPGVIKTNISRHIETTLRDRIMRFITGPFSKTPREGAQTQIYLCVAEEVEGVTGKYFGDCKEQKLSSHATDPVVGRKLWEVSEQLVGLKY